MKESGDLWADVKKHGVQWAAKKYGNAESTLYDRWKPRKEELKQKIWETKKAHPQWTNKEIKEKLGVYFSESTISRIIQDKLLKEYPSHVRKYGSLERMIDDSEGRRFLSIIPKLREPVTSTHRLLKKGFNKILFSRPGKSRTTVWLVLKEFFTYLAGEDERAEKGLLLQLPPFKPDLTQDDMGEVDVKIRLWALILHRYRVMKKIDEVCLKGGIDLRSMVWDQEKLGEAAFIIYNLKRALRYKFAKSLGAKSLQEVLTICKKIIALANPRE